MLQTAVWGKHGTGLFQSLMEHLLQGIPGVIPYFDDILVSGANKTKLIGTF